MANHGPILLIDDDDIDEGSILKEILQILEIKNELLSFPNGEAAFHYLKSTSTQPFIILSDVNMPKLNGIDLRKRIEDDEEVKRKSVPFIFLTTTATPPAIEEAYEMSVQGFFEKPSDMLGYGRTIKMIYDYWQVCRHPNNHSYQ